MTSTYYSLDLLIPRPLPPPLFDWLQCLEVMKAGELGYSRSVLEEVVAIGWYPHRQ